MNTWPITHQDTERPITVNMRSVAEAIHSSPECHLFPVRHLRSLAQLDRFKRFRLVDEPTNADLVIFIECHSDNSPAGPYLEEVRKDPVYKHFRSKSFVHFGSDRPLAVVPGIYPSIERRWAWRCAARSGCYIVPNNPYLRYIPLGESPKYLGSFIGCARSIEIRHRIAQIKDERLLCIDNTDSFIAAIRNGREKEVDQIKREYVEASIDSKFILCPKGFGASSIRLFEAMEMGRSPVVISDHWVPPDGPDWESFLLRIREKDINHISSILRDYEATAEKRGSLARRAWEEWFGTETLFHRVCETCWDMMQSGPNTRAMACAASWGNLVRPLHLRYLLRRLKRDYIVWIEGKRSPNAP